MIPNTCVTILGKTVTNQFEKAIGVNDQREVIFTKSLNRKKIAVTRIQKKRGEEAKKRVEKR